MISLQEDISFLDPKLTIFFGKIVNIIFINLLVPFKSNIRKILNHFWVQNDTFGQKENLFGETINVTFKCIPLGSFHCTKLKKKKLSRFRVVTSFFQKKNVNLISFYLLAPFMVQNFTKTLRVNPEYDNRSLFGHLS